MISKKTQTKKRTTKEKVCAYSKCEEVFEPYNSSHKCHHWECSIKYAEEITKKRKEKAARLDLKEFNQQDVSWLKKNAQSSFNAYIRARDKHLPCISCDHDGDRQIHAGHYRPTGRNSQLRYNEDNCHAQCSICNAHLSGNLVPYREALIKKIGLDRVEALENDNKHKSYSVSELQNIIKKYKQKLKLL